IVIEKKFSVYMYSRLLVPSILLSSYGIISLLDKFKEFNYYKNHQFVLVFSISLLIFSPFLKYSKSLINSYLYLTNTTKYNESYEINSYGYSRTKYLEIAEYVRKTTQKNDKVLVIGNGSNILSYFLADYKQYPF